MYKDNDIWKWRHSATSAKETGYEGVIDSLNIIRVDDYVALPDDQKALYVDEVLRRIRDVNIYPIYYYSEAGIDQEIKQCMRTTVSADPSNEYSATGTTLLEFMFPNLHLVDSGNVDYNCLYSRFYDDAKMRKCLNNFMSRSQFTNMRTMFAMTGRYLWSTATGFTPMRAKAIYEHFCPEGGVVYDFSAGFGGRMLGALTSSKGYTYIACEPCINTYHNLNMLGLRITAANQRALGTYTIINECSEDVKLERNSVDFAFSCPPYYALERYSNEPTQSVNKYSTYKEWLLYYVYPTLTNVYNCLKPGKLLCFVIAYRIMFRGRIYDLGDHWCSLAEQCGFTQVTSVPINNRSRKEGNNIEYMFVFKK